MYFEKNKNFNQDEITIIKFQAFILAEKDE